MTQPASIDSIFCSAIEFESPDDRHAYLDEACGDNAELRRQIDRLLDAHFRGGSILDGHIQDTRDMDPSESPGAQIGPFKLLQVIGEGGMGVVYLAEQKMPVKRRVALKIIKPGMDSSQVIARFEAERQALAMMEHPSIAKVMDAGQTESGRPYFAMELVKGIPITEYCDQQQLPPRERLQLFVDVCHAVQHAHQKGIIHRDLKPSNVLVARYDNKPVVKVIDFGVAKAMNQELTERTMFTQFGQIVGTLEYMSPEQAQLNQLDIDTRTDVYALGVLLYELLVGETPFDRKRLRSAAFDEVLRIIREEEPPKPSTRISTSDSRQEVAANRRTEAKKLGSLVRGELDWIVMKALDKDRQRRYESSAAFGQDIERYLSNERVLACPPTLGYRFRKYATQHLAAICTASVIATSLLLGMGVAIWQANKAVQALNALKEQIEQRALTLSFEGDSSAVRSYLEAMSPADLDEDTKNILLASAYFHNGENDEAIALLEPILDRNPNELSALAMAFIAYMHEGKLLKRFPLENRLRALVTRDTGQDSDVERLFLAYAYVYIDFQEAKTRFDMLLTERPSWLIPRMMWCGARAHMAQRNRQLDELSAAVADADFVARLVPQNRLALMIQLFTYVVAIEQFDDERTEPLRAKGMAVAEKLEAFPDYCAGKILRLRFYETVEEPKKLDDLVKAAFASADRYPMLLGASVWYRHGEDERVFEALNGMTPSLESMVIQAYCLANQPGGRSRAMNIYNEITTNPQNQNWYVRYLAIQIPLLAGDADSAVRDARRWIEEKDIPGSLRYERLCIQVVADSRSSELKTLAIDRAAHFKAYSQAAMVRVGKGDLTGALRLFEEATSDGRRQEDPWWMNAFHHRLQEETQLPKSQVTK